MNRFSVLFALLFVFALPALAGFHFVAETSVEGEGGDVGSMTVEAWVEGANAKILIDESRNPLMTEGSYLLTRDGGETLYLVNPEEETYSVWNLEEMLSAVGGAMQAMSGFMKLEVTEPEVEKLLEEDGGSIHGYPTTHYRYRTSYTMSMKVMGMKRADRYESEQDIWATTALEDEAFGVWLRNAPKETGYEAFDNLMQAEFSKVRGFPLKTIQRTTTTGAEKEKRASTATSTMEVTLIEEASPAAEMFELDPAFEEVPMMPVPGQMPGEEPGDDSGDEEEGGMFKKFRKKMGG